MNQQVLATVCQAVAVAVEHANSLTGQPLLVQKVTLKVSSHFTGKLVFYILWMEYCTVAIVQQLVHCLLYSCMRFETTYMEAAFQDGCSWACCRDH